MVKIIKTSLGFLLAISMIFTVEAAETGSIFLDYHFEEQRIYEANFHLFLLYEVDTRGDFVPTSDFEDLGEFEDFTDNDTWLEQSKTVNNFINLYSISPDISGSTDDMGRAEIEDLEEGVYLLRFDKRNIDDIAYEAEPILLTVPGSLEGNEEWVQSIIPKTSATEEIGPSIMTLAVMKLWRNDDSSVRPLSITIALYENGSVYEEVELNAEKEWTHIWYDMDGDSTWAVKEVDVPLQYTSKVSYENYPEVTVFYVENTYNTEVGGGGSVGVGGGSAVAGEGYDTDVEGDLAQTGAMLLPVPILIVVGMGLIVVGLVMRKGNHEEN